MAGGDRVDHGSGPRHDVAGGEHAAQSRHRAPRVDRQPPAVGQPGREVAGQEAEIGLLADRREDVVGGHHELAAGNRDGPASSARIRLAELHLEALDTRQQALLHHDSGGRGQKAERHPLRDRRVDLLLVGRHLLTLPAIDDLDRRCLEPERRARGLDRRGSAADHDDLAVEARAFPLVDPAQESERVLHRFAVLFTRDTQASPKLGTHREQHRRVAVGEEVFEVAVRPHLVTGADLDTGAHEHVDLVVQHGGRQTIVGDAVAQHAASLGLGLEHRHPVPGARQIVGGGQARGARADDGHALRPARCQGDFGRRQLELEIGDEALQRPDRDGAAGRVALAGLLAWMVADAAADPGQADSARGPPRAPRRSGPRRSTTRRT